MRLRLVFVRTATIALAATIGVDAAVLIDAYIDSEVERRVRQRQPRRPQPRPPESDFTLDQDIAAVRERLEEFGYDPTPRQLEREVEEAQRKRAFTCLASRLTDQD